MEHPKRLLIVSEDRLTRVLLSRALREEFVVFNAATLEEALFILRRTDVDAIVGDLSAPDLAAVETVEVLRENAPSIPFVLTADHLHPQLSHLMSEGVKVFVTRRPFGKRLARFVAEILGAPV